MAWPYDLVAELDAAPGAVALASGDPTNPGTIWIATVDGDNVDHSGDYAGLGEGDLVRLTAADNADLWHEHLCVTAPTIELGVVTIANPVHMADGTPGSVLAVPSAITVTVNPTAPEPPSASQFELMEHHIELGEREPLTPVDLPAGWTPLQAERRAGVVVVLLMRRKTLPATLPAS